ncbi:Hydroxymethylglutaryl-CoA synthase, cytoplasmic, partial [Fragariocoptes setiger]
MNSRNKLSDQESKNEDTGLQRPKNIGILSMSAYFPKTYVDQNQLEIYDTGAPGTKYTIGLGQAKMGFCTDLEDIHSMSLTVTQQLLEKSGVALNDIGFLMVGTETLVDKSKSVKSVLMQLFESSGNSDIQGVDTTNACYGGTAALFHALDWISGDYWDGRLAIVVAADIAIYAKGGARPTGGCGAVAMLIGPNAPLVFDRFRATHMHHDYDFYKADLSSEYPIVDGKLSLKCYLQAVDKCYSTFREKYIKANYQPDSEQASGPLLNNFDAILLHSPYCKLVRKSVARLLYNEYLHDKVSDSKTYAGLEQFKDLKRGGDDDQTFENRDLERVLIGLSQKLHEEKTEPSLYLANQVGNMYTASLYSCLVSYLTTDRPIEQLAGKKLMFFSYGSGSASSMFSATLSTDVSELKKLVSGIEDVRTRLAERIEVLPADFSLHLSHREVTHHLASRKPIGDPSVKNGDGPVDIHSTLQKYLFPGTYYLESVDDMFRRRYQRLPIGENNNNNSSSSIVLSKSHMIPCDVANINSQVKVSH